MLGSLAIAWWSGSLTWANFRESLLSATRVSCMIMFILAGAKFLSMTMGYTGVPRALAEWVGSLDLSPYAWIGMLCIIYVILGTRLGERLMQPTFGCGIHDLAFAPNNPATRTRAVEQVRRALVAFEPRIDVLGITTETSDAEPSLLLIRVDYRIRANNAFGNLVYPFYITEAA